MGANSGQTIDVTSASLNIGTATVMSSVTDSAGSAATLSTAANSANGAVIDQLDKVIKLVNDQRAALGAVQSRFENTISFLQTAVENQSAARGRIMDADFASETATLSRAQILQQAGTAMIAQANQLPQGVLALLR